jgi:hypothetical protein
MFRAEAVTAVAAAEVTATDRAGQSQFLPLARQPVSRPGGPLFCSRHRNETGWRGLMLYTVRQGKRETPVVE